jgi:acyl-CoA synthetase (AMP-forming)/AMP-acid ligase II
MGASRAWAIGDKTFLENAGAAVEPALLAAVEAEVYPADPAVMIYTSGSTSEPKAVVHTQGSLVRHGVAMAHYAGCQPGHRVLSVSPFFWVGGLCTSLLTANINGAALVCPPSQAPSEIVRVMRTCAVTHTNFSTARVRPLLELPDYELAEFQRMEPLTSLQMGCLGLTSPELTPNSLGMSETMGPHSMEFLGEPLSTNQVGSFGRGVEGVQRRIVDPYTRLEQPVGVPGELLVRGYSLMSHYYKRERRDCFDEDGWFSTGDNCTIDADGHLYFHGRLGEMLKTSGANVAPREVELVAEQHPDIREAIVLGIDDEKLGEKVVGVLVLEAGAQLDARGLRSWMLESLSSFKVPKLFLTIDPSWVPRTNTGKVQISQLRGWVQTHVRLQGVEALGAPHDQLDPARLRAHLVEPA